MAKPFGAPSAMGRAEWRVQVFCPQDKTLAQAEFTSAEHFYKMVFSAAKPHPKPKPSVSGFGLERSRKGAGEGCPHLGIPSLSGLCGDEVDVGDNGNISQFFVPHTSHFLLHAIKTAPARPLCSDAPEPGSAAPTAEPRAYISPLISVQTLYYTALC